MRILKTLAVTGIALAAMPAQALIIDNFDTGPQFVVSTFLPGPTTIGGLVGTDTIGGSRTVEIYDPTGAIKAECATAPGATTLSVGSGTLAHGQNSVSGGCSRVTWDAGGTGLGGVDLTDGGTDNGLMVDVVAFDTGIMSATIEFIDTSAGSGTLELSGVVGVGSNFLAFVDIVGAVDLTMIDSIILTIVADASTDAELEIVGTTFFEEPDPMDMPEPSIIGLLGIAAVGLGYAARRRR